MTSWSYSNFTCAVTCLQKYHYYITKQKPDYESGDMAFGTALHAALNAILTGGNGEEIFQVFWSSYQNKELKYSRFKWQDLENIGFQFLAKFQKLHAKKYKLEFAEERLYAKYRGISLEGTMDFLGQYEGKKSLRDFKTSGYNYDKDKKAIALQLYLYAYLAIQNGKGTPETLGYTVFNKGASSIQDLTWDFKIEDMQIALDQMVKYLEIIDKGGDIPVAKNFSACIIGTNKCQFWQSCHGGQSNEES